MVISQKSRVNLLYLEPLRSSRSGQRERQHPIDKAVNQQNPLFFAPQRRKSVSDTRNNRFTHRVLAVKSQQNQHEEKTYAKKVTSRHISKSLSVRNKRQPSVTPSGQLVQIRDRRFTDQKSHISDDRVNNESGEETRSAIYAA